MCRCCSIACFATRSMRFYPDFQIIRFFQICSLYSKLVFSSKSNFLCSTVVLECTVLFYVLIGWYTERIGPWRYFCLSANKKNLNALPDRGWTWTKWLHFLLESPSVDHHVTSKLELEIFRGRFPWSKFVLHQNLMIRFGHGLGDTNSAPCLLNSRLQTMLEPVLESHLLEHISILNSLIVLI